MVSWRCPTGLVTASGLVAGARLSAQLPDRTAAVAGAGALVLLLAASRFPPWPRLRAGLSLAAVLVVAAVTGILRAPSPPPCLPGREACVLAGQVLEWKQSGDFVTARVKVHSLDGEALVPPAVVRVLADGTWGEVPRARWIRVRGRLTPHRGTTCPGAPPPPVGEAGALLVARGSRPEWGPGAPPRTPGVQAALARRLHELLPGFSARFAEATLLGRASALTAREQAVFRRAGATHLVAVSGFNIGLAGGLAALVLQGAAPAWRVAGVSLAGWAYTALAGWAPSALRAAVMLTAVSLGVALRRARSGPQWLALGLPWLLWMRPDLSTSVSFQLSVGAVAGLLLAGDLGRGEGRGGAVRSAAAASLGAQWGTLPITVSVFGTLAPLALLPNLLLVPMAAFFLPAILLALAAPSPEPASTFTAAVLLMGRASEFILEVSARALPYMSGLARPASGLLVAWAAVPVIWFGLPRAVRRRASARAVTAAIALLLVALVFLPPGPPHGPWVAFLDVGQGDAAVLRLSDGTVWVVDVGDDRGPGDAARNVLLPFLRYRRIRRVDGLVLSHRHRDHVGGLGSFLAERPVEHVFDAAYGGPGGTPARVDSILAAHGVRPCLVAAGDTLHRAPGISMVVIHPARGDPSEFHRWENLNDRSVALRIEDHGLVLLFTGDMEVPSETACLARGMPLSATVLKVGHHGSPTSSTEAFLDAVAPRLAVISCGEMNTFGHPAPQTLRRLKARGVAVRRTDCEGTVIVTRGRHGSWHVRTYPPRCSPLRSDRISCPCGSASDKFQVFGEDPRTP